MDDKNTSMDETQRGTILARLEPFLFTVRLQDGSEIVCGFSHSYFGRCTPIEARKQIEREGLCEGDTVIVLVFSNAKSEGFCQGVIVRSR
jgi:hypothetical protein